jgi:hypothetical protein
VIPFLTFPPKAHDLDTTNAIDSLLCAFEDRQQPQPFSQ